jgi:hypothetical protein
MLPPNEPHRRGQRHDQRPQDALRLDPDQLPAVARRRAGG